VVAPAPPAGPGPWRYVLAATFILLVVFAARYLSDADLGYHLRGGQWILEHHGFPSKDTYTYTRSSADYLDLHWVYQLLIYATYVIGGYTALSLLNIVLVAVAFALAMKRVQLTGAPVWIGALLLVLALLACEVRFQVRPEILSWIYMLAMLWVLEFRKKNGGRYLFLLPVIQVMWTNSEGLFGIGIGLMAFSVISDFFHSSKVDKELLVYTSLATLSCLINPYGLRGILLPFTYLATLDAASPFKQAIAEFQSPWTMGNRFTTPALALLAYKVYFFFLLFLLLVTFRKRQVRELLLAGTFAYLSATALRNIPLFMLATLPIAAAAWSDLHWTWLETFQSRVLSRPAVAWVVVVSIAALVARTATNAEYISEGRLDRFGLGLDTDTQPVRAGTFLVANHLEGRILNQMNTGGWLDWVRPGQVFIDGRTEVMGEDLFVENTASLAPGGLARIAAKYRPDILFFNPFAARQWLSDLDKMTDWRLVHVDEVICVFLRKDYAPEVPALDADRLLTDRGIVRDGGNALALLREPAPPAWQRAIEGFYRPVAHPNGLQMMALFFQYRGEPQLSEAFFLECIRRNRGHSFDFYFNAGLMYYLSHQNEKARACMERVLDADPGNAGATRILGNLSTL
jgi:hypothetical protein